jgi:hypothetical protein
MIWVILAALGVPLWLCAAAILTLLWRNRSLRKRLGDIPVRMRSDPEKRWRRGHAVWVHDVLSFRASPAGWSESLLWTTDVRVSDATEEERKKLHRLGDHPVIARLTVDGGDTVELAGSGAQHEHLLGPHPGTLAPASRQAAPRASQGADDVVPSVRA